MPVVDGLGGRGRCGRGLTSVRIVAQSLMPRSATTVSVSFRAETLDAMKPVPLNFLGWLTAAWNLEAEALNLYVLSTRTTTSWSAAT